MQGLSLQVAAILTVAVGRVVGALVGDGSVGLSLALGVGWAKLGAAGAKPYIGHRPLLPKATKIPSAIGMSKYGISSSCSVTAR